MEELFQDHSISSPVDCYRLKSKDFSQRSGGQILLRNRGGFVNALKDYFGDTYRFKSYRFGVPGCWDDPQSIIDWREDFESENPDFSGPEDYYKIRKIQIPMGLRRKATKNSPSCVVKEILFPEYEFDDTLFSPVPDGTWKIAENRIKALRRVGEIEGFENEKHWYSLTQKIMNKHKLGGLMNHWYYANGKWIQDIPKELYPDYDFLPWLFENGAPPDFWSDITNIRSYMKWLDGELKLRSWYDLRVDHLLENRGSGLISIKRYAKKLSLLVVDAFPEQKFDPLKFRQRGQMGENGLSRLQEEVTRAVQSFFTGHKTLHEKTGNPEDRIILINHKHDEHLFSNDGDSNRRSRMESDIWVMNALPEIHMSIETHGDQHRRMPPKWSGKMTPEEATEAQQQRDAEKRITFDKAKYIVIEIWGHEWIQAKRNPIYVHELIKRALQERS